MSIANPYAKPSHPDRKADYNLRKWASYASVATAIFLIVIKLGAFIITDAVSLLASLIDSTVDAVASVIVLLSIKHANEPADEDHRYGHGKLESLAAMGQAVFIAGSAVFLFYEALHRFVHPQTITEIEIGVWVMGISIAVTLALVCFQGYVIKKTGSVAIDADSLHYKGDILINVGVIIALVFGKLFNWPYFDPIITLFIMGILIHSSFEVGKSAADILMDKEIPLKDREKIFNLVLKHEQAQQVHDLRTRSSGAQVFIEFHLELDGNLTLQKAHDVTEELELILYKAFPNAEVLIHQEPCGIEHDKLDDRITP